MLSPENKQMPTIDNDDIDITSDPAALAEYYKEMFASSKKNSDELRELYDLGDRTAFDDKLQFSAEELADADSEFIGNISNLKQLRLNASVNELEIQSIKHRQREIIETYRQIIIAECGLPDESRFSEMESARNNIDKILTEAYGNRPYTRDEALTTLGIISLNNDDSISYQFPDQLMPPTVLKKWETYLATVCSHVDAANNLTKTGDRDALITADATRKYAHDSIAVDFKDIIGLSLDKESSRQLLAKIRDQVFPNQITSNAAKEFMRAHESSLSVVRYLTTHHH